MILIPRSKELTVSRGYVTLLFDIVDNGAIVEIRNVVIEKNSSDEVIPKFLFLKENNGVYDIVSKHRYGHEKNDTLEMEIPDAPLKRHIIAILLEERGKHLELRDKPTKEQ